MITDSDSDSDMIDIMNLPMEEDPHLDLIDKEDYDAILKEHGQAIYQIQGVVGEGAAHLMQVGVSVDKPHLLIKEYQLNNFFQCQLLSFIFHPDDLQAGKKNCWMPMVRLRICHRLKHQTSQQEQSLCGDEVASFLFSFHTFIHLQQKKEILDLATNKEQTQLLPGFFRITFHHHDRYQTIETIKEYPGHHQMLKHLGALVLKSDTKKFLFRQRKKN